MGEVVKTEDQSELIIRRFRNLPLGTRFRYFKSNQNSEYAGGDQVWVILERHGCGKAAAWNGLDNNGSPVQFQSICIVEESDIACENLMVIVEKEK